MVEAAGSNPRPSCVESPTMTRLGHSPLDIFELAEGIFHHKINDLQSKAQRDITRAKERYAAAIS